VFSTGAMVTSVQLDVVNPVFCCSKTFRDGTTQEITALVLEDRMPSEGDSVNGEKCSV